MVREGNARGRGCGHPPQGRRWGDRARGAARARGVARARARDRRLSGARRRGRAAMAAEERGEVLVRRDGRDVSTLYGREGEGGGDGCGGRGGG